MLYFDDDKYYVKSLNIQIIGFNKANLNLTKYELYLRCFFIRIDRLNVNGLENMIKR